MVTFMERPSEDMGQCLKLTPTGVLTTFYAFTDPDGAAPFAGLLKANDGNFYGTTFFGGVPFDRGTVFKLTPAGVLTTLHSFSNDGYPITPRTGE